MQQLDIKLFGGFEFVITGQAAVHLPSHGAQELFAFLLLHRRILPRDVIMTALWGEEAPDQCRKHLRQALWKLHECARSFLGMKDEMPLLVSGADTLQLNPQVNLLVDVAEFEDASMELRAPRRDPIPSHILQRVRKAVTLYRGDLLEGWYSDWCLAERERLQNIYLSMLDRLITESLQTNNRQGIEEYAARLFKIDPTYEQAHRALICLYLADGDRAGAMRQFKRCSQILQDELRVPPSDETLALAQTISDGQNAIPRMIAPQQQTRMNEAQEAVSSLKKLQAEAARLHTRIQRQLDELERAIGG